MNNLFQNNYESENDQRLDKKFSYNYQVIKNMYPKASELPEEEVRKIIQKYYQAPQGQEEQVIKNYISQKEPEWQTKYFDEDDGEAYNLEKINAVKDKLMKVASHLPSAYSGEAVADIQLAYNQWKNMNKTADRLVAKYGKNVGAGAGIDNYYHPMLQCELAKISPESQDVGLMLGYLKEAVDIPLKLIKGKQMHEVLADSYKDLKNNMYGSILGSEIDNTGCIKMLDHLRTRNMRSEGIY